MKILRPISVVVCLCLPAAGAKAQNQLLPPPGAPRPVAKAAKPAKAKIIKPAAKKPAAAATPAKPQLPPSPATPAVTEDPNADVVFGAYQRGQYKTAFDLATARAGNGDPKRWRCLADSFPAGP